MTPIKYVIVIRREVFLTLVAGGNAPKIIFAICHKTMGVMGAMGG